MTVKEFLEKEVATGVCNNDTTVEVMYDVNRNTINFMSVGDMLDADADYLYSEVVSTNKDADSYTITV